ncbi:hypothetical protein T492DRAFT_1101275 [Pavlovales sp. CCMP2436]|nr:hypothetical protein T492DRAFT_1101275 [Pavlovales sp. CCMP2436]
MKGKVIIARNYRGDVPMSVVDHFARHVQESEEVDMKPIVVMDCCTFLYIKTNNLYSTRQSLPSRRPPALRAASSVPALLVSTSPSCCRRQGTRQARGGPRERDTTAAPGHRLDRALRAAARARCSKDCLRCLNTVATGLFGLPAWPICGPSRRRGGAVSAAYAL